jgi:biopolymer transport protein ExbD
MTDSETKPPASTKASVSKYKSELRKAIRRNQREPEINFLNITAMLDIVTIILVFLLKSMGESTASIPQSDDLRLPISDVVSGPTADGVPITVSKTQILVDSAQVVNLPGRESLVQSGVGARYKRSGANDLYIVPLGNTLQEARRLDRMVLEAQGKNSSMSEAIIIADKTTPFRLLSEVLFTLGDSEFGKFHLMVLQKSQVSEN